MFWKKQAEKAPPSKKHMSEEQIRDTLKKALRKLKESKILYDRATNLGNMDFMLLKLTISIEQANDLVGYSGAMQLGLSILDYQKNLIDPQKFEEMEDRFQTLQQSLNDFNQIIANSVQNSDFDEDEELAKLGQEIEQQKQQRVSAPTYTPSSQQISQPQQPQKEQTFDEFEAMFA
ncbi:MAG: hypothetical protein EZS28_011253 [Streblomastix strix]|uniref:Uncharacterized protein n=1 Tax=Streblomastix strix TaxID=222440 RepID=A0A5J4WE79_9EUKA|nr:MAG: hypothetical protein EZS28_011253 [Streblomastix strix]